MTKSQSTQPKNSRTPEQMNAEIADLLARRFVGVRIFHILILLLVCAILWAGVRVVEQIYQYREDYKQLQTMKQEYKEMQIEYQRLLIEQQTFSATPKIASRAINELKMYYPKNQDKLILPLVPSRYQIEIDSTLPKAQTLSDQQSANAKPNTAE